MKSILTCLLLLMCLQASGQFWYPYPQPKPLTGTTPNTVLHLINPVGINSYDQPYPAVWDTDIGGSLQSRTNAQDRLAAPWLRYGSIVFDQTDQIYYAADALEGHTNFVAYRPLFSINGVFDTSIYNTNGTIDAVREVTIAGTLTFKGPGNLNLTPNALIVNAGSQAQIHAPLLRLAPSVQFELLTPGMVNSSNGWVLTLMDKATGRAEWAQLPPSVGTNVGDGSIYLNDGNVLGPRRVNMSGNSLAFDGGAGSGVFSVTNMASIQVKPSGSINLEAPTLLNLKAGTGMQFQTPALASAKTGNVLTLLNTSTGQAEWSAIPPLAQTNIYTHDGTLTGTRTLHGGNQGLLFDTLESFEVNSAGGAINLITSGDGILSLQTDRVGDGKAVDGEFLKLVNAGLGHVEFSALPASTNIYNSHGTLTSDRTLTGAGKDLHFTGIDVFDASATNLDLVASGRLGLRTPELASASEGHVLTLLDKPTGKVDFRPFQNLYSTDGILLSNRIVQGGFKDLSFSNLNSFNVRNSQNTTIGAVSNLYIRAPSVAWGLGAASNMVFTLMDPVTGRSEFTNLSAILPPTPSTNIYTHDGTISDAIRTVNIGTNNTVMFEGLNKGGTFRLSTDYFRTGTKTNFMFAIEEHHTQIGSSGHMKYTTPRTLAGGQPGEVLTINSLSGSSAWTDFAPLTNFYTANGTFPTDRIVAGNSKTLLFQNLFALQTDTKYLYFNATNEFRLRTPAYHAATAAKDQVLTLIDATTGQAEWRNVTPPTVGNIYTIDGTLTANRTLNMGFSNLVFQGSGQQPTFSVTNVNVARLDGKDVFLNTSTAGKFSLRTPRVNSGAATSGHVLTFDGTYADFQPIGSPGIDKNIYEYDGTNTADRTFIGANYNLTFDAIKTLKNIAVSNVVKGSSGLWVQTPKASTATATIGHVLTAQTTDGQAEWSAIPPANTLYTGNGNIETIRLVNLNNSLTFAGTGGGFTVTNAQPLVLHSKTDATIGGLNSVKIQTPNVLASKAVPGRYLSLLFGDGTAEWTDLPGSQNIYNTSASLTTDRNVGLASKILNFNGPGNVNFSMNGASSGFSVFGGGNTYLDASSALVLRSPGQIRLETPKVISVNKPSIGDVLTMQSQDGRVEFQPAPNLYTTNGNLSGNRIVTGLGNSLTFQSLNGFTADAFSVDLAAHSNLKLQTPNTFNASAKAGWVMTAKDGAGNADWAAIPTIPTLYTQDGTITGPTARNVQQATTLFWNTFGHPITHNIYNGPFTVQATGPGPFTSTSAINLLGYNTTIQGTSKLYLKTPAVTSAFAGYLLKLVNPSTGEVEFGPAPDSGGPSFYNEDGNLDEDRTVNAFAHDLNFFNVQDFKAYTITHDTAAISQYLIKTPFYYTNSAALANGQVLTLVDKNTGKVEFQAAPGTATTIYTGSGDLLGNREVRGQSGTFDLSFIGLKNGLFRGVNTVIDGTTSAIIQSTADLRIRTPKVVAGDTGLATGHVLKLDNLNGKVEFAPIGSIPPPDTTREFIIEMSDTSTSGSSSLFFSTTDPRFSSPSIPAFNTRYIFRLNFDGTASHTGQSTYITIGPSSSPGTNFFALTTGTGGNIPDGLLNDHCVVEAIFVQSVSGGDNGFVMLNAIDAAFLASAGVPKAQAEHQHAVVGNVGAVDVAIDLAWTPITFKKISTLGYRTVGDGRHGDYYLTDWNPDVPMTNSIRSSVDPRKMWKELVRK